MLTTLASVALLPLALAAVHDVKVGPAGKITFEPEFVKAAPGDVVRFTFNPKNHTITQSSFDTPCVGVPNGARTGFVPVAPDTDDTHLPRRLFVVPDGTAPLWFYCGQTNHCGQGMVFAINPPDEPSPRSFSAYKALAISQNGTLPSGSVRPPPPSFSTPPPQPWTTATATVTWQNSVYTTTYTSYAGSPDPTPAPEPVNHKILVGDQGLNYNEANIQAKVGDIITFEFRAKNHTVTESTFLTPCSGKEGGFRSGFRPVAAGATEFPTFEVKINDTAPIWGYCGQVNHCASGMVFAINAVESGPNNFNAFLELAQRTGASAAPVGPAPGATGDDFGFASSTDDSVPGPAPTGAAVTNSLSYAAVLFISVFGAVMTL